MTRLMAVKIEFIVCVKVKDASIKVCSMCGRNFFFSATTSQFLAQSYFR